MGGCASSNKNIIHPQKQLTQSSLSKKWKINQNKDISSSDKLIMHQLDQLHSEADNVVEEFEMISEYFNSRLEKILESNQIYNSQYNKIKLLKNISKQNNIDQLEKLVEIVHKTILKLPKIEIKISSLQKYLQNEEDMFQPNTESIQRKYIIMYKLDGLLFKNFANEIQDWDQILKKHTDFTYEDIKEKKRTSNDSCFQPPLSSSRSNYQKPSLLISIKQSKNLISNNYAAQIPSNRTQSTLNQSYNFL